MNAEMERPVMDEHGGQQPVVRSTVFAVLEQDHHALVEAMHGILGRVQLLEARVNYLEHGRTDAKKLMERTNHEPSPAATQIGLAHCGRNLFVVEGESGLWGGKRDFDDESPRSLWATMPNKRGSSRSKRLYRQDALSARMATVLEKCFSIAGTNTKGISDGD